MLEAKQSPSCHHLSLIAVESDLKAADSKVTSSKTDPFLLQNLHMERQGRAITVHRSSKRIWCKVQSCTTVKAMQAGWQDAHMPWRQGKVAASSATITCLGPLATVREKRARSALSLHSHSPTLSADANTQIFRPLSCLPMLHHSKYLQETCFFLSHLLLRPRFSLHLFCFAVFAFLVVWFAGRIKVFLSLPSLQGWNLIGLT